MFDEEFDEELISVNPVAACEGLYASHASTHFAESVRKKMHFKESLAIYDALVSSATTKPLFGYLDRIQKFDSGGSCGLKVLNALATGDVACFDSDKLFPTTLDDCLDALEKLRRFVGQIHNAAILVDTMGNLNPSCSTLFETAGFVDPFRQNYNIWVLRGVH